jgi:methyl-accepting chemotaxis protein
VRTLAQRSAGAAKEIRGLIQNSLQKVERGSALVNRSGATLLGIVGSVKRVTDIVGEIAAASAEQSTGVDQVNTAVTQMDQVTQSNSARTEELASTAQGFADEADRLTQLVSQFKLGPSEQSHRDNDHQLLVPGYANDAPPRPAKPGIWVAVGKLTANAPTGPKRLKPSAVLTGSPTRRPNDANLEELQAR